MKQIIFSILFFLSASLFSFNIPVLTLNNEFGSRYELDSFEDNNIDYISFDGYSFYKGYAQVVESINKYLSFKFKFYYNMKKYDTSTNLNNNAFSYHPYLSLNIKNKLKLNFGIKYNTKNYLFDDSNDFEGLSPNIEIRYSPIKYMHLGAKYSLISQNYLNSDKDYFGNRASIWYEQRIIPQVNLRMRYRIENRDYKIVTSQRSDSFKHSFSATLKIDLNK